LCVGANKLVRSAGDWFDLEWFFADALLLLLEVLETVDAPSPP